MLINQSNYALRPLLWHVQIGPALLQVLTKGDPSPLTGKCLMSCLLLLNADRQALAQAYLATLNR